MRRPCALCGTQTTLDLLCRRCARGAQIITASRWWCYPWGLDYGINVAYLKRRALARAKRAAKRRATVSRSVPTPE